MTVEPDKSAALEFREVSISFEDRVVLDRVSFSVPNGEMRLIVGPSNSGKSTLLKLAIGLLRPDAGQIRLFGREITSLPEEEFLDLRQQIGVVFQTDALFSMSVADNVAYRLNELGWEPDRIEGEVRRVLRIVGLAHAYDMMPEELSGGMSRRTAVARAIAGSPQMVLYDSPCSGLDPVVSRRIMRAVVRLRDIYNVTSLYVTQNLDEVRYLCSRFYDVKSGSEPVLRREANDVCVANTRILMLTDGKIIFDEQDELFWTKDDERIQRYLT